MLDIQSPQDYLEILRRRRSIIALVFGVGFLLSVSVALLWPPTYRSIASILIEEPDVPRDLVSSTVTSFADERIQVINQRVMTTPNLTTVIEDHGLYREERKQQPMSMVVKKLRENITLELIGADVRDPRSGKQQATTIAFSLSFDDREPSVSQRVLNELVSLYLAENVRLRRKQAAETTGFLEAEAEEYRLLVKELEQKVADFKSRHSGTLPEQTKLKIQLSERTENELLRLRTQLQALEERNIFVQAQLAQIDPNPLGGPDQEWDPVIRLKLLQSQYVSLKSKYGPNHPDLRELEREIKVLESEVGPGAGRTALESTRASIIEELVGLRQKYSEQHPDVVRLKKELASVEETLARVPTTPIGVTELPPSNPAYIQLQAQLAAINSQTKALNDQRAALEQRLRGYENDILAAPEVEREYLDLIRDYDNAVGSFKDVKARLTRAELGESLEAESKSERFSLIEPPSLPLEPASPNRPAVLVIGTVLWLIVGVGVGFFFEYWDRTIYGARQLAAVTGAPPIVVISTIETGHDVRRKWTVRLAIAAAIWVAIVAALLAVDSFVLPLDVIWSTMERRFDAGVLDMLKG